MDATHNHSKQEDTDSRMPDKDPTAYQWITYLWVIALSVWGGAVNYIRKVRTGATRPFNFMELVGEIFTSGFVGVITFWLCEAAGFDQLVTAAIVGISAHMGSRALFMLERAVENRFNAILGKDR